MDPAGERDLANYLRSGFHGAGLGLAVWAVQTAFAASARSSFGAALRRLPVGGEILIRSLAMTAVLVSVGVFLQFVLYTEPLGLRWFTADWLLARRRAAWRRRVWHDLAEDRRHWVRHLARMLTLLVTLTTSMTSLWTVLVILSSFLLRVFGTLDIFMQFIRWLFDVDAHPVRVIGLVAAFIVWLASTLYSWL
jgi:hypothetical protein